MTEANERTFQSLGDAELQFGISDEEIIFSDLFKKDALFLGYYSDEGLDIAMQEYGIKEDLRLLGYDATHIKTQQHANGYQMQILQGADVLIDVVLDIANLNLSETLQIEAESATHRVLYVHWLEMRNLRMDFEDSTPPLPAQQYPGLGLGNKVYDILKNVCKRLNLDAIVAVPMYFHNAIFYSKWFRYADPKYEGIFRAIKRDSKKRYEKELAFSPRCAMAICAWSFVVTPPNEIINNIPFPWFTEPILSPISESLKKYLHSDWYKQNVKISEDIIALEFSETILFSKLSELGVKPYDRTRFQKHFLENYLDR